MPTQTSSFGTSLKRGAVRPMTHSRAIFFLNITSAALISKCVERVSELALLPYLEIYLNDPRPNCFPPYCLTRSTKFDLALMVGLCLYLADKLELSDKQGVVRLCPFKLTVSAWCSFLRLYLVHPRQRHKRSPKGHLMEEKKGVRRVGGITKSEFGSYFPNVDTAGVCQTFWKLMFSEYFTSPVFNCF